VLVEDHDPVPLGLFLALARRLVAPRLRCRHAQIRHRPSILGAADFGIGAEVADQDHFVDAACHHTLHSFRINPNRSVSLRPISAIAPLARARPVQTPQSRTLPGLPSLASCNKETPALSTRIPLRGSRARLCSYFVQEPKARQRYT